MYLIWIIVREMSKKRDGDRGGREENDMKENEMYINISVSFWKLLRKP